MSNQLITIDEMSWQDLANQVFEDIDLQGEDIPDNVIAALEYLMAGLPISDVAKRVGKSPKTIRAWIRDYPIIAVALSRSKELVRQWREAQISGQFADAMKVSLEVLQTPHDGDSEVNAKLLGVKAQHARYIIGLLFGQKADITVTHEVGESVLAANSDALDYLAMQIANARENEVPSTYRIIDGEFNDAQPIVDEEGNPLFGEMGLLHFEDDIGSQCHICGGFAKHIANHVHSKHSMDTISYEATFGLEPGTLNRISNGK